MQIKFLLVLFLWSAFMALIRRRMHTKIIKMFRIKSQEIAHKRMKAYKKYKRYQNTTIANNKHRNRATIKKKEQEK